MFGLASFGAAEVDAAPKRDGPGKGVGHGKGGNHSRNKTQVLDAREYPGAIGGRRIQNALDDAAEIDGSVVVVDGDGPDDVSRYPNATRRAAWLLDAALSVPAKTELRFRGAHLLLDGDVNENLVRNEAATSGDARRDADIYIVGDTETFLNGNARAQGRPPAPDGPQTEPDALEHFGVLLHKVDRCRVGGFQIGRTGGWGVVVQDFTDCEMRDLHFRQDAGVWNQDGCSFIGPGNGGRITGITGRFGDDFATVYGNVDWLDRPVGGGGDVSNVTIANCEVYPAEATDIMPSVRLQTGGGTTVSDVRAERLSLNGGYFKLLNANGSPSDGGIRRIAIEDVTSAGAKGGLALGGRVEGLTVSGYDVSDSSDIFFYANGNAGTGVEASARDVHVSNVSVESDAPLFYTGPDGGDLDGVTFHDVTYSRRSGGGSGAALLFYNGQTSHDIEFSNVTIDGNTETEGLYIGPDHTISDFTMSNVSIRDVTDGVVIMATELVPPVEFTDVMIDSFTGDDFYIESDEVVITGG